MMNGSEMANSLFIPSVSRGNVFVTFERFVSGDHFDIHEKYRDV
jgi:hypothetical protein